MYMASYISTKRCTFSTHETIEQAKSDAINHAKENSRSRGKYLVNKVETIVENLVSIDLTEKSITGIKHGKEIEWEGISQ